MARQQRRSSSSWWQPGGLNQGGPPSTPAVCEVFEGFCEARGVAPFREIQSRRTPIREALPKAREQCRVQLVGERLDSTFKFIQRSRARIEKIQVDLTREQSLLQQGESLKRLREEEASSVPEPMPRAQEQWTSRAPQKRFGV